MTTQSELTQELVRELFDYNPETGDLTWRNPRTNRLKPGMKAANLDSKGYLRVTIGRRQYRVHRVIWLYVYGSAPDGLIDHKNRIRTDNRLVNLRISDELQNVANRGVHKNNKTGYKGVFVSKPGKFTAQIMHNRKAKHLGYFKTAEEAHAAYISAAKRLFGEFASS